MEIPPLTREEANSLNLSRTSQAESICFLFFSGGKESRISKEAYYGIGNTEEKLYENNGRVIVRWTNERELFCSMNGLKVGTFRSS